MQLCGVCAALLSSFCSKHFLERRAALALNVEWQELPVLGSRYKQPRVPRHVRFCRACRAATKSKQSRVVPVLASALNNIIIKWNAFWEMCWNCFCCEVRLYFCRQPQSLNLGSHDLFETVTSPLWMHRDYFLCSFCCHAMDDSIPRKKTWVLNILGALARFSNNIRLTTLAFPDSGVCVCTHAQHGGFYWDVCHSSAVYCSRLQRMLTLRSLKNVLATHIPSQPAGVGF